MQQHEADARSESNWFQWWTLATDILFFSSWLQKMFAFLCLCWEPYLWWQNMRLWLTCAHISPRKMAADIWSKGHFSANLLSFWWSWFICFFGSCFKISQQVYETKDQITNYWKIKSATNTTLYNYENKTRNFTCEWLQVKKYTQIIQLFLAFDVKKTNRLSEMPKSKY